MGVNRGKSGYDPIFCFVYEWKSLQKEIVGYKLYINFIRILYNFEKLTLPNQSPPKALLGSGFYTDPPPWKCAKFSEGGGDICR